MPPRGKQATKKKVVPAEVESPPPSEPSSPAKTGSKRKASAKQPAKVETQKRARKSR